MNNYAARCSVYRAGMCTLKNGPYRAIQISTNILRVESSSLRLEISKRRENLMTYAKWAISHCTHSLDCHQSCPFLLVCSRRPELSIHNGIEMTTANSGWAISNQPYRVS